MLGYWLRGLVDCMRHEEEKIAGNTRDRGEKQGRARSRVGYCEPVLVNFHISNQIPRHKADAVGCILGI